MTFIKKIIDYTPVSTDMATLLLRLTFGGLFIRYGYMKLISFDEMLAVFGDPIGLGTRLSLILVIFAEFFCAILVTLGIVTRLSVIPIFITMMVAFFIAHAGAPFDERVLALIFLMLSIVIFILGSGRFSVDGYVAMRRSRK